MLEQTIQFLKLTKLYIIRLYLFLLYVRNMKHTVSCVL